MPAMMSLTLLGLLMLLEGGLSQPRYPLLNQCHVMSVIAEDLTSGLSEHHSGVNCSLIHQTPKSPALDCTHILCHDDVGSSNFSLKLMPCSDPPALKVTQIEPRRGIFVNTTLSKSQTIALELGGGSDTAFLFFGISQHTNQLTLGFEVLSVSTVGNTTIVPHREIPVDRNCSGVAPLTSDTCRVMRNVTQYLNYFFSTVTTSSLKMAPECLLSMSCNDISCILSNGGYYNLSILPCQTPPTLQLVTSGYLSYKHTTSQSEIVPFSPLSGINLNITFEKIDHFFMGLALEYTNASVSNKPFTIIPYVEILPNKSMCTSDDYTHSPLLTTCDVMPLLLQSRQTNNTPPCSMTQNCTTSNCRLSSLGLENATVEVNLFSCFDPPAIDVSIQNGAGVIIITTGRTSNSKSVSSVVEGSELRLNVTIVQRKSRTLLGVQVTGRRNGEVSTLIPYHDIPISCSENPVPSQVTDTYKVMSNLAQFITVFIANVTNQPELTPECTVIEPPCHSIACSSTDGSHYNFDISPCASPPTFHLEVHRSDGVNTFERTYIANNRVTMQYNKNTHFQVTMSYDVNLIILELLVLYHNGTHSFTLPAIPYVRIPINSSDCEVKETTNPHQVISTTPSPNDKHYQMTILAIEIGVPSVLVFIFVVCCSLVLLCKCVHRRTTRTMNYSLLKVTSDLESDDTLEDDQKNYFT